MSTDVKSLPDALNALSLQDSGRAQAPKYKLQTAIQKAELSSEMSEFLAPGEINEFIQKAASFKGMLPPTGNPRTDRFRLELFSQTPEFWTAWNNAVKEKRPCENGTIHWNRGITEVAYFAPARKYMCSICYSQNHALCVHPSDRAYWCGIYSGQPHFTTHTPTKL